MYLVLPGGVLQGLELVEPVVSSDVASVNCVHCRPEHVLHGELVRRQRQLRARREQELAHAQTRHARRAVVLYVEVVR